MRQTILLFLLAFSLTACGRRNTNANVPATSSSASSSIASAAPIPAEYQKLYAYLQTALDQAENQIDAQRNARTHPLTFAAELIVADSNRGTDLLLPATLPAVKLYLDRLQTLGVRGVKISVQYPLLTANFPNVDKYIDFYRQVASEVKQRQMILTIQASVIFAGTNFTTLPIDFKGLTFDRFKIEDKQMVQTIIDELHPDYLVIVGEPDTAANLTGIRELNDPAKSVEFVQFVLQGLNRGATKIAAGTGTWSPTTFAERYAKETALDCIVLHVYPVSPVTTANAFAMANAAKQNGKCVLINEAWLYKIAEARGGNNVAAAEDIFKRDAYSFWQPLDQEFLRVMVKLSDAIDAEFLSPFWSPFFFGYIDYAPRFEKMPYNQVHQLANEAAFQNIQAGKLSTTGAYYQALIAAHR